jgi:hypothetical protein
MVTPESTCKHTHIVPVTIHLSKVTNTGYIAGPEKKVVLCLDCGEHTAGGPDNEQEEDVQ